MLGAGLTKARKELNLLKKKENRFLIFLDEAPEENAKQLNQALFIYQNFIDSWKEKDKVIVKEFLEIEDYKMVADKVGIDPSNAWRRKKSLRIVEYNYIKELIIFILNKETCL